MKAVAMAPYERPWSNVELIKDCGLIPYLLHKNYGFQVKMVGAKGDGYTYLPLVDGIELEFLENGSVPAKVEYIKAHAKEIDLLILRGCYNSNFMVAYTYKVCNPMGKTYVGLDANSVWMDGIDWEQTGFKIFMDCCDVIATSGKAMQEHLNLKWPWKIAYVPNGYYSFGKERKLPPFCEKENIILTVARIGTEQKADHIMLEAFALAADAIPDWSLRMVGTVDPQFEEYLKTYFQKYPALRDRVILTGAIADRDLLYEEYRRAKIFTLSSEVEGGTPNVIAEALHAGCALALTRFDAAAEATDGENCGIVVDIDDAEALGKAYVRLALSEHPEELSLRAYRHGRTEYDMENIVDKLYERLFGDRK